MPRTITHADSPYKVLPSDGKIYADATDGNITIDISAIDGGIAVRKIDHSEHNVTIITELGFLKNLKRPFNPFIIIWPCFIVFVLVIFWMILGK